jgi:hypothetical protein
MAKTTMTYDEAQEIANNPNDYSKKDVAEAKKFLESNTGASVDMSLEEAQEIKANPNDYSPKDLAMAKTVIAQHRPAPGKWIGKYIPIKPNGGFNFNWKQAYNKPIKNDDDVQKLDEWKNTQVWDVDDKIDLRDVAKDMGFKHSDEGWEDFIKSDRFPIFQDFLKDVQKAQRDKEVEKIWSGEEPSQQWTPFGYKEVPGAMFATNFMTPVAKEYAKNHYDDEDINTSMIAPILVDAASNLVMTGPGLAKTLPAKASEPIAKFMNKPFVSKIYGNVTAPAITETGNVIYNDESVPEALLRTAEGAAINIGTPRALEGTLSWAGRGLPTKEGKRTVQKMIDEAANKAAKVQHEISEGKPYPITNEGQPGPIEFIQVTKDGKKYFSSDVPTSTQNSSNKYESIKNMPDESITFDEFSQLKQGVPFLRGKAGNNKLSKSLKDIQDAGSEYLQNNLIFRKATALAKDGDLRNLTPVELRQLGFTDKESLMNYLIRTIKMKMPSTLSSYMTNASGRPEFGRRAGPIRNINYLLGTNLFDKEGKEHKIEELKRIYGL